VTTRTYDLGEGTLVTLIVATEEGPIQVDVAVSQQPLDPADPRRPGDIIFHDADTDREAFTRGLEAVAHVLRGAS
jgi:hypothetical protein